MSANALSFSRPRAVAAADRALLCASIACSAVYFVTKPLQPFPGSIVLKGASVALLAVTALRSLPRNDNFVLGAALALSSLGDVFLDLTPQRFIAGLASFLCAHLVYAALFVGHWPRPLRFAGATRGESRLH